MRFLTCQTREMLVNVNLNQFWLLYVVADTEFTLADTRRTFEFRLEHLSLRREPFGTIAEH